MLRTIQDTLFVCFFLTMPSSLSLPQSLATVLALLPPPPPPPPPIFHQQQSLLPAFKGHEGKKLSRANEAD